MFRFLIGLFTLITSFFGFWGSTSPLLANVSSIPDVESSVVNTPELPISLNSFGSLIPVDSQNSKNIFDHLGCSCVNCLQTTSGDDNIEVFLPQ